MGDYTSSLSLTLNEDAKPTSVPAFAIWKTLLHPNSNFSIALCALDLRGMHSLV